MASAKELRKGFAELAIDSGVRILNREKVNSAQRGVFRKRNSVVDRSGFAILDVISNRPVFRTHMDKNGRRSAVSEVEQDERKILMHSTAMMNYYKKTMAEVISIPDGQKMK